MTDPIVSESEVVPIASLKLHPRNPRRGHLPTIKQSLETNGQYRPILVHAETRTVIAGNHTLKAAKALGWTGIAVTWFHGTEDEALVLLLEDNKSSDGSVIDPDAAYALAQSLTTLTGTGYAPEDFTAPDLNLEPVEPAEAPAEAAEQADTSAGLDDVEFRVGRARGSLSLDAYTRWRAELPRRNSEATEMVLSVLGLVVPDHAPEERSGDSSVEAVPLRTLIPFPGNPNQGDVGLLTEMLRHHGQTRPIVVSRRTNRILVGNHVARAAAKLGWENIGVSWVDVDSEGERRIVLVDNRSHELAGYAMDDLAQLIASVGRTGIEHTGFTLSDLDDVIAGRQVKMQGWTRAETPLVIGQLRAKVRTDLLTDLNLTQGKELVEVAAYLGIDVAGVSSPSVP